MASPGAPSFDDGPTYSPPSARRRAEAGAEADSECATQPPSPALSERSGFSRRPSLDGQDLEHTELIYWTDEHGNMQWVALQ
mmetsp:Transcript_146152/g.468777  ORF Transcript_146152/g.468777 Transcript_146152/m.468777 type:complete len:82 (+) Transcript_146152:139-384(+)